MTPGCNESNLVKSDFNQTFTELAPPVASLNCIAGRQHCFSQDSHFCIYTINLQTDIQSNCSVDCYSRTENEIVTCDEKC
uniref:Uncharacterized protein n=1 Tax=Anguilla anguilla TaxID=7936 RepID=A0A0E9RLU3_ANGAN